MELLLLKLVALALIATSGVHARDQPSVLRGSDGGTTSFLRRWIQKWIKISPTTLEEQPFELRQCVGPGKISWEKENWNFASSSSNWRNESYNKCTRNGVDDEVSRIEKECLENDISKCSTIILVSFFKHGESMVSYLWYECIARSRLINKWSESSELCATGMGHRSFTDCLHHFESISGLSLIINLNQMK